MNTVQLQSDTMRHLWQFKSMMQLSNFEIHFVTNTLFCQLSEAAIKIAEEQFGARRQEKIQLTQATFNH